jgi:hypothetical protein
MTATTRLRPAGLNRRPYGVVSIDVTRFWQSCELPLVEENAMLRKFCIINTCGREDCGNHTQDHEHGAYYLVQDVDARIAQMQIEIDAVTRQRDETYAKLVEAREKIQQLTFGSAR